jgi:flagellar basal body-associated protein FliL
VVLAEDEDDDGPWAPAPGRKGPAPADDDWEGPAAADDDGWEGAKDAGGGDGDGEDLDLEIDEQAVQTTLPRRQGGPSPDAESSFDAHLSSPEDSLDGDGPAVPDAGPKPADTRAAMAVAAAFAGATALPPDGEAPAGEDPGFPLPVPDGGKGDWEGEGAEESSGLAKVTVPGKAIVPPRHEPADPGPKADGGGGAIEKVDRTRFLESLGDGGDAVPQKVELDLDGIFDQARKEADELKPDSTSMPVTAPLPEDPDDYAPAPPPEPLAAPTVRKVSKFKLLFLIVPVAVGALGLLFGIYQIFLKDRDGAPEPAPGVVITPEALVDTREPVPGEMPLGRFMLTLDASGGEGPAVAQMEIILHYHDTGDERVIRANMVFLRDAIFRITKSRGAGILKDPAQRRQLQADLLATLNELPAFRTDQEHRCLTYVQISLLKGV